jgi:DNA-binding transcriptional MerR regulator
MRISELARAAGLSVATVKYYLREGLLPAGQLVSATQAEYGEAHLARLRLLRILREVGRVPVGRLRDVVAATEDETRSLHQVLEAAARALTPAPTPTPGQAQARDAADAIIADAGWTGVAADAPDRANLASALAAAMASGTHPGDPEIIRCYVEAADTIGRLEVADLRGDQPRAALVEQMVVGQVVFGEILAILRRLSEEHYSARRFGQRSAER